MSNFWRKKSSVFGSTTNKIYHKRLRKKLQSWSQPPLMPELSSHPVWWWAPNCLLSLFGFSRFSHSVSVVWSPVAGPGSAMIFWRALKEVVISVEQVLVAKACSLIEQADVILLTNFLCEKKRQTLNWGCRESAANVRITAWVLILVQVFVLVRLVGSSIFMLISASHPLQESPCLFVGSLLHLMNTHFS